MTLGGIQIEDKSFTAILQKYHVKELAICGSRSRGDYRNGSDIDFLVEFLKDSRIDLFDFVELKLELEDLLGIQVDLGEKNHVKPHARNSILADACIIYSI